MPAPGMSPPNVGPPALTKVKLLSIVTLSVKHDVNNKAAGISSILILFSEQFMISPLRPTTHSTWFDIVLGPDSINLASVLPISLFNDYSVVRQPPR